MLSGLKALQHKLEKSGCKEGRLARAQKDDTKTVMYPELLEICRQLKVEFEECPSKFEQSRLLHDLVLLLLYCTVNPGRTKEYVTLKIATENLHEIKGRRGNFILFQNDGSEISLFENDYKTAGTYGPITTDLQKFDFLCYYLKVYIKSFRTRLLCGKTRSFLFCNTKGDPFSDATFKFHHLQEKYDGHRSCASDSALLRPQIAKTTNRPFPGIHPSTNMVSRIGPTV